MIRKHFNGYNFVGIPETGVTFRWGDSFSENPYSAPWPEIADISISNYCTNGCEHCYRSSDENGDFMSVEDYRYVLNELSSTNYGKVFQVALGGGEPLLHPEFNNILQITREEFGIIPNYTTCGRFFYRENLDATRKYCGAVAISWDPHRESLSLEELSTLGSSLLNEKIRTNIHYVVSEKTLPQSIEILSGKYDEYLKSFNSIIFLTYKPTGRAVNGDVIKSTDKLKLFLDLVQNPFTCLNIGFDACFVPVLMKNTKLDKEFLDSCECGFFSVYIDEKMNVKPCSFCNSNVYSYNLKQFNFEYVWHDLFANYRSNIYANCKSECRGCTVISECRGRCPFFDELFLCKFI
jgi:radical SAM protein with 4Fe4S-binding SPASM domain